MKAQSHVRRDSAAGDNFITKGRLDLNDLIKRRQLENKINRKTNLIILSGATTIAAVVLIILIL